MNEARTYRSQDLPATVYRTFATMRGNNQFCDFTISIGTKKFPVHKLILAACSDHFRSMLLNDCREAKNGFAEITNISETTMQSILDYCYTSSIKLDSFNVQDILSAASFLQIQELTRWCSDYLQCRMDYTNCLGFLTAAYQNNLPQLIESTTSFCLANFERIMDEEEFLKLDEDLLSKLLASDNLEVSSEEKVIEAIQLWLKYRESTELDTLLTHIRFPFIGPRKLIKLESHPLFSISQKWRDLINEAKNFLLLQHLEEENEMIGPRFKPRQPLRKQQRIYAVGGWTNNLKPIASVEKYNPYEDLWIEVRPMTKPRCGAGATVLGECLYVVGGHDGQSYLKSVEKYDIVEDSWSQEVSDMKSERTSVGVVSLNGFIYAIGGQIGSIGSLSNVERYNPETNKWEDCAPMNEKRLGAGVAVLNGLIFVMGGGRENIVLKTVECYNPQADTWTYVQPMTTSRKHLGCASYDGRIYAVGGRGEVDELETAEYYDPSTKEWVSLPSMSEKRSGIGLVELDGLFYAVGGHNGDTRMKLVEAYDPNLDKWLVKAPMNMERLGGGLAVHSRIYR